jgi:hypothetical protein
VVFHSNTEWYSIIPITEEKRESGGGRREKGRAGKKGEMKREV